MKKSRYTVEQKSVAGMDFQGVATTCANRPRNALAKWNKRKL